jgi:hypothetical protein
MDTKRFLLTLFLLFLVFKIGKSRTLESRVESFYKEHYVDRYDDSAIVAQITNPVFNEVFPKSLMYKIALYPYPIVCDQIIGGEPCTAPDYASMVSRKGKNYRMPQDFNQLMLDAGHELNEETQDALAHALIVAALPSEMAEQSLLCGKGYEIDEGLRNAHYTYVIDCRVGDVGDVSVWFWPFEDQFREGLISWGNKTEYGWREFGQEFSIYPTKP